MKEISRRGFLKGTAAGVIGVAAMSVVGAPLAEEKNGVMLDNLGGTGVVTLTNDAAVKYEGIYDVVVVGAGAAGLCAAYEAAAAGLSVLVIECEPGVMQSNTALCGGVVMGCNSSVQAAAGVKDDPEEFKKYLAAVGAGYEDSAMMDVWANESGKTVDWLISMGVNFPVEKLYLSGNEPGFEHITPAVPRGCITAEDSGSSISNALYERCVEKNVEFLFKTMAKRLITDPSGRVVGVVTDKGNFRGGKGVALCTAGFSRNKEWIKSFKPDLATGGSFGSSHQQGDGIKMGMAVGAKIGNMWITQADTIGTQLTEEMCPCMVIAIWKLPCIFVSQDGLRHMAEDMYYEYQCGVIASQPGGYVWSIWDQTITDMGPSVITVPACSKDCLDEIAAGTMFRADTIEELAVQLGIDPATLANTVNHYNEMMRAGVDEDFGRASGLGEVIKPPFYAAKTVPATCDTAGGLITNVDGQVISLFEEVIPGLYAAGSTTSGWRGELYPGSGTAVSIAVTFGRRAGISIASEKGSSYEGTLSDTAGSFRMVEEEAVATADNEFIGEGMGMGGSVKVKITVDGGKLTKVEVIEHAETPGIGTFAIDKLPDAIVAAQSADVDSVTGASLTSEAIKTAVREAMAKAGI